MGAVPRSLISLFALGAAVMPAAAQQQVKIGIGYGLAFLPLYVCEDMKLVEKHGKEAHLELKPDFQRYLSAAQTRAALDSGALDMGPFGLVPLLTAWQSDKDAARRMIAVSGITSLPMALLSNQPDEHTLGDLKPADRIAVPTPTSPQMYLLQMQSEKTFGQYDRLKNQMVVLPHADAITALVEGAQQASAKVTAYFASPPFTQLAMRDAAVHPLLSSSEVMNGKSSFLIMGATKAYLDAQPQMAGVIDKAIDEAARLIHDDPRRAAQIYLTHEPSGSINGAAMEDVIRAIKDEFGSAVYGVATTADFMGRHGGLSAVPKSWKEIVAPALLGSPST